MKLKHLLQLICLAIFILPLAGVAIAGDSLDDCDDAHDSCETAAKEAREAAEEKCIDPFEPVDPGASHQQKKNFKLMDHSTCKKNASHC